MSLNKYLNNKALSQSSLDPKMLKALEDHISYFKSLPSTIPLPIEPHEMYRREFDLTGFLVEQTSLPKELHWVIFRVNDMASDLDFTEKTMLLLPNYEEVMKVMNVVKSTYMKK